MATDVPTRSPAKDLKRILQNTKFCTVCLNDSGKLLHLEYSLVTGDWGDYALSLKEVLKGIFKDVNHILLSAYICEQCKTSAVASYAFITTTNKTARELSKHLTQLETGITNLTTDDYDGEHKRAVFVVEPYKFAIKVEPLKISKHLSHTCDICGESFLNRTDLINHSKQHDVPNSKTLNCPHCRTRPCLHEKYLISYNEQIMREPEQITCVECNKEIGRTVRPLIAHVNKEHLNIQTNICQECGEVFYLEYHYKKHLESHKIKYICVWCSVEFRSEAQLNSHIETCKNTVKTIKCSNPVLPKTRDLASPVMFTDSQMEQGMESTQAKKRIIQCLTCNEMFSTRMELRKHIIKMHKKKPNLCIYCNKQFDSKKEYLEHVQTEEHRNNMPYNIFNHHCSYCDYAAGTAVMLTAHMNRVHLKIRPFTCEVCQKCYFNKVQMKNHMKIHTGQIKPKVCDICGAHLAGPTALKKHRRLHTGEKPYSCPYCDVKTNCSTSLKYHVMRKHNEPTINCPLCDQMFHTMNNARGHVRKTHWKSKEKFDYTKLEGLSPKDYDFFRDRRKAV